MKAYRYRVNYGNGQVCYFESKATGFAHIASLEAYREFAFMEWQDPDTGDWFRTGTN